MPDTDALASELYTALRSHRPVEPLSARHPDLGLDEAYAIQQRLVEMLVGGGDRVVGWKLGLTSKPMQNLLGVDQPDFSPILQSMTRQDGATIQMYDLIQPRVEAELTFVLGAPLVGPDVTAGDAAQAASGAAATLEVIDSRIIDWKIGLVDTVADLASGGAAVLSSQVPTGSWDPRLVGAAIYKNDELAATGAGAAALGNPLEAVAWLARTLSRWDAGLEAGQFVMTGSLHAAFPVEAGDSIRAEFDRIGSVAVEFA